MGRTGGYIGSLEIGGKTPMTGDLSREETADDRGIEDMAYCRRE